MNPPRVRCFWAVRPPQACLAPIGELVRVLKRPLAQLGLQVAWTKEEAYHFTLAFLGEVEEDKLGEMSDHVQSQLTRSKLAEAPQVQLKGLGLFAGPHKPQVVFVEGVAPTTAGLPVLQAQLAGWLAELGHTRPDRPFHPHLTIGRVRSATADSDHSRQDALRELLARHAQALHGPPFAVAELILFESQLGPSGPKYTPLARIPVP